jgi:hypothetical protein
VCTPETRRSFRALQILKVRCGTGNDLSSQSTTALYSSHLGESAAVSASRLALAPVTPDPPEVPLS